MAFVTRKTLLTLVALAAVAVAAVAGFIWSGFYNVAADDPHTAPVYRLLETMRERSIQARAGRLEVPADLMERERIVQGSGNYNAMCMGCHLAPGMDGTEMSRGLYPAPPDLSRTTVEAAEAFWVIKHGIKASGMPAWGESMDDEYIWNMVAFLQELPGLDAGQYQAMVASSGGHDHGGGETEPHAHPAGTPGHEDGAADPHAGMERAGDNKMVEESRPHAHPPGTPADHHAPAKPAATPTPAPEPAPATGEDRHDGHDHDH
jgi:mono/diheme cytochrome c family protein